MLSDGARPQPGRPGCRRRARGRAGVDRRPALGRRVSVEGATVVVVGAGYTGKRPIYERMVELGARVVIVDEAGHWSERLVEDGVASQLGRRADHRRRGRGCRGGGRRTGRGGGAAGRRSDLLGDARAGRGAGGGRAGPSRQPGRGRRRRAQQAAHPRGVRARRPAHAEVAAGPVARRALRGRCGDRVPGRDQAGVRRERRRVRSGRLARVSPEHLLGRSSGARDHARRRSPRGQRSRRWRSTSTASSSTSTWSSKTASACSRASPRTGRPPSRRFRKPDFTARPTTAPRPVRRLVELSVQTVQAFGFARGVLHVEGKCTAKGPRIVEVNARMGGGRIHQIVEAVWGVDLIEAHLRAALGLPQQLAPSRKPRCAVVTLDRLRPGVRPSGSPAVQRRDIRDRLRAVRRRLRSGGAGSGRAGSGLLDGARGGLRRRQEPASARGRWSRTCCAIRRSSCRSTRRSEPRHGLPSCGPHAPAPALPPGPRRRSHRSETRPGSPDRTSGRSPRDKPRVRRRREAGDCVADGSTSDNGG